MKLLTYILFFSTFIFYISPVNAQRADDVLGVYLSPKKDGKISIYKKAGRYFGKLIWGSKNFKDIKNPDSRLRNRDVVGSDFMFGFEFDEGQYINGKIYDATTGKTYDCKMWLEGNQLKVRGFVGFSAFGRTEVFSRVG